jgi:alpha-methylacyl-CoA racemase
MPHNGFEDFLLKVDLRDQPAMKERFIALFLSKTRDEWTHIFEGRYPLLPGFLITSAGTDACVTPVLEFSEVEKYAQNAHRQVFLQTDSDPEPGLRRFVSCFD